MEWDYKRDLARLQRQGKGIPRFVFIASPCNAWSLMRYGKGRIPPGKEEIAKAKDLVRQTERILRHIQRMLDADCPGAELLVVWENPSSARERGLMQFLKDDGILDRLGLQVVETSQCAWGFNYSKPTHFATNLRRIEAIMVPPCIRGTIHGKCQKAEEHDDVRTIARELAYRLPTALINVMGWMAYNQILEQDRRRQRG